MAHQVAGPSKVGPPRQTPENRREDFRRYLEKAGVLDSLTRVLIGLYEEPEKPLNPMEYFLDQLAGGVPVKQELDQLQEEFNRLEARVTELEDENKSLKQQLEKYELNAAVTMSDETGAGEEQEDETEHIEQQQEEPIAVVTEHIPS